MDLDSDTEIDIKKFLKKKKNEKVDFKALNNDIKKEENISTSQNLSLVERSILRSKKDKILSSLSKLSLRSITFKPFDKETLLNTSVFECNTEPYSKINNISDPRLGVLENGSICATCSETNVRCPGHKAYISLPKFLISPIFKKYVILILKSVCITCSKPLLSEETIIKEYGKAQYKNKLNNIALNSEGIKCQNNTNCPQNPIFISENDTRNIAFYKNIKEKKEGKISYMSPERIFGIFNKISDKDSSLLGFDHKNHPRNFIINIYPLSSPFCRRYNINTDGTLKEDDITVFYKSLINLCSQYSVNDEPDSQNSILNLINDALIHIVSSSKETTGRQQYNIESIGAKLKSKEGFFREKVLGKRANFTCRTNIDPSTRLMQFGYIGMPKYCFSILTVPEVVTIYNYKKILKLADEGKIQKIIPSKGDFYNNLIQFDKKMIINIGDIVERNSQEGDYIVFNRQPTIHKHSMLGFKIKPVDGFALRVHLSNVKGFNADFDGDEMNISQTQTINGRAENMILMNCRNNINNSYGGNTPSVTQNALLSWYLFTLNDKIMNEDKYEKVFENINGGNNSVNSIDERIIKAAKYYCFINNLNKEEYTKYLINKRTGRGIFSLLLPEDFMYKSKEVVIYFGVLLKGTLGSGNLGTGTDSIIKNLAIYYSNAWASDFITNASNIGYWYLETTGFTLSIKDCVFENEEVVKEVETKKDNYIKSLNKEMFELCKKDKNMKTQFEKEDHEDKKLGLIKKMTIKMKEDFEKYISKDSSVVIMRKAGSKGAEKDQNLIFSFMGQQYFKGRDRAPLKYSRDKRWLFTFHPDDKSIGSRGFCRNSLMQGMDPNSYIANAASAREAACDTHAGGLQNVGYINRLSILMQANNIMRADGSVRNEKEQIISCCPGFNVENVVMTNKKFAPFDIGKVVERINAKYFEE